MDEPYVTMAPRSLEEPSVKPPPGVLRFRAPAVPARRLPDWWQGGEEPLVYMSFGSVAAGAGFYPGLYRDALERLADLPVRVLLTLGTEVDPGRARTRPGVRAR